MVVHSVVDATHFTLYSLAGSPIATNGAWANCSTEPGYLGETWKWTALLTPESLATSSPTLEMSSTFLQKFALGTSNGLSSITATGCPAACVLTVATSFDPTAMQIPVAAGQSFSIWNTTSSVLNTAGTGTTGTPWTVASVSSGGWVGNPVAVSGATNGTYTTNNACGPKATPDGTIGGTQNCVRLSFIAIAGNPFWDQIVLVDSGAYNGNSANWYKMLWDGGNIMPNFFGITNTSNYWLDFVYQLLVDQSNTASATALNYAMTHATEALGVNWFVDETASSGGLQDGGNYIPVDVGNFATIYQVASPYQSSTVNATFRNQFLNDLDDPTVTPCSPTDANAAASGHRDVLGSGVAQGGTSTSITLASSDTQADGYYVNSAVEFQNSGCVWNIPATMNCLGVITSYVSATKIATVASGWFPYAIPANGNTYEIYSGITMTGGGTSPGNTGTVTGYHTHFTTMLHIGDMMIPGASFPTSTGLQHVALYVTNIASDTSATVVGNNFTGGTGVFYMPAWKAGDCGCLWYSKHWGGFPGGASSLYPPDGGSGTAGPLIDNNMSGGVLQGYISLGIALAPDDSRAVKLLASVQSYEFDYNFQHVMHTTTGFGNKGSYYTLVTQGSSIPRYANIMANSIPSYPSQDLNGSWTTQNSIYKIFSSYPDFSYWGSPDGASYVGITHEAFVARWGSDDVAGPAIGGGRSYLEDNIFLTQPNSTQAQMLRYWLQGAGGLNSYKLWGMASYTRYGTASALYYNDPRIGSTTFATLPHQYLFNKSSATTCAALTGWLCPSYQNNAYVYSRTGWTSKADGLLWYLSSSFFDQDHDFPHQGSLRYYRVGELLYDDISPPGSGSSTGPDEDIVGSMLQIGAGGTNYALPFPNYQSAVAGSGAAPIIRWSSANAGGLGPNYGDQNSNYVCATSDLTGVYTVAFNYAQRTVCHLKPSGGDEFIVQHDAVSPTVATAIATHIHYPQNGEAYVSTYPEGNTTCPGAGGCTSLNTTRWIQELEDGGAAQNVIGSGTYVSGITATGTVGQTCKLTILGSRYGTGGDATATVALTGTNTIAGGTALTIVSGGIGYGFAPTSASVTNGTAPCSGTATVTASGGANGDPARTYGLVTKVLTPIAGTVAWDCPLGGGPGGSDECSTTSTYSGGAGHTDRVSVCGGSSCGSSVSTFEDLVVHKVAQSLSDTTLTTAALTPDSNWSGVQACGSTSCMVYVGGRAGATQSTMTGFTTTHSGTAQYLFDGLTAGTYTVTVGGSGVTGSPFTVAANDNSIEFVSTAGTVSVNGSVAAAGASSISAGATISAGTIRH
jgi:hypothetical protein